MTITLHLAGDSTVANQPILNPYDPNDCYCGWGQVFGEFFNDVLINNLAHSGRSMRSFREEGRWNEIIEAAAEGDYVFIQFGHNDQKIEELAAETGYRFNLFGLINEARYKKAVPIIVTPLARNTWENGVYADYLEKYSDECERTGNKLNVAVLNLHGASMSWIKENGFEACRPFYHPNDNTHPNLFGGFMTAGFVRDLILIDNHPDLARLRGRLKPIKPDVKQYLEAELWKKF